MKSFIGCLFLITSFTLFAAESVVHFNYFGNNGRNQTYYACSYVEDMAFNHLEALGALNVDIRCSGGIQPWGTFSPISLTAKFTKPVVNGTGSVIVELEGDTWRPHCDVNARMINAFLKEFDNIKVITKRDSCAFQTSNYYFKLEIQK